MLKSKVLLVCLLLFLVGALTACDDGDTYAQAACIDNITSEVLDNSACSPNYGPPLGSHSWGYHDYPYDDDGVDVFYVGSHVPRDRFVYDRPRNISITHIEAPSLRRAPGAIGDTYRAPSLAFEKDGRNDALRKANPDRVIQRGGLGIPGATATAAPIPKRTLDSPAPGRGVSKPAPANTAPSVSAPRRMSSPPPKASTPKTSTSTGKK